MRSKDINSVKAGFRQWLYRWGTEIFNPLRAARGLAGFAWYFKDWRAYSRLPGAEPIFFLRSYPRLHDRTPTTPFDEHYLYLNSWAMRRILATQAERHIDIGSETVFAALLSSFLPVVFLDLRPVPVTLSGLICLGGSILQLPFPDGSIDSISCLHVAEHIGLGRYGDALDPKGTENSARELQRILAPGGNLFFAVPVGKPALYFNAHRVHSPQDIMAYFGRLKLVEFSAVSDNKKFLERTNASEVEDSEYACGMFWFRKPLAGQGSA